MPNWQICISFKVKLMEIIAKLVEFMSLHILVTEPSLTKYLGRFNIGSGKMCFYTEHKESWSKQYCWNTSQEWNIHAIFECRLQQNSTLTFELIFLRSAWRITSSMVPMVTRPQSNKLLFVGSLKIDSVRSKSCQLTTTVWTCQR